MPPQSTPSDPVFTFNSFSSRSARHCEQYLERVAKLRSRRAIAIRDSTGAMVSATYPTLILCYEMPGYYGAELVGSQNVFQFATGSGFLA